MKKNQHQLLKLINVVHNSTCHGSLKNFWKHHKLKKMAKSILEWFLASSYNLKKIIYVKLLKGWALIIFAKMIILYLEVVYSTNLDFWHCLNTLF